MFPGMASRAPFPSSASIAMFAVFSLVAAEDQRKYSYEPQNSFAVFVRKIRAMFVDAMLNGQDPQTSRLIIALSAIAVALAFAYVFASEIYANMQEQQSTMNVSQTLGTDAETTDPGLLKKHSTYQAYTATSTGITYPSVRTFYRPHPQGEKLPNEPAPLPLLVFIHGLGGSIAQFHPLLTSLVNVGPCLGIDLPGCGMSKMEPRDWSAYTTEALVALLETVIEEHRDHADDHHGDQGIVLIGHSMGCSLAALLASATSPFPTKSQRYILGFVAICPRADPPSGDQTTSYKRLLAIPGPIFDMWRRWDRRGGTESTSVLRFVGQGAEQETKELQIRFNEQSRTPVWRRMAYGAMPHYSDGTAVGGIPGKDTWAGLEVPTLLIAGESDAMTPPLEAEKIARYIGKRETEGSSGSDSKEQPNGAVEDRFDIDHGPINHFTNQREKELAGPSGELSSTEEAKSSSISSRTRQNVLKTVILPAPASHALLYAPSTCRTIAGLIQSFLADHVDERLSLGWQLQYLTTEGKWDVKNLAKWQAVTPVSEPIGNVFRAMKTLREVDDKHYPAQFVKDWKDELRAVIDISHESPVYNPNGLEEGGIEYHKFPTVSKLPPTLDEVKSFITLVDRIRSSKSGSVEGGKQNGKLIGIHCHYGFNRTGFFIVCYLVEREGYRLQDAIDEFARQRPPGIRHEHFIDTLFVRYHVGLKRAPTL